MASEKLALTQVAMRAVDEAEFDLWAFAEVWTATGKVVVNEKRLGNMNRKLNTSICTEKLSELLADPKDVGQTAALLYVSDMMELVSKKRVCNLCSALCPETGIVRIGLTREKIYKIGEATKGYSTTDKEVVESVKHGARVALIGKEIEFGLPGGSDVLEIIYFEPDFLLGAAIMMQWCGTGSKGFWASGPPRVLFKNLGEVLRCAIEIASRSVQRKHVPKRFAFTRCPPDMVVTFNGQGPWSDNSAQPSSSDQRLDVCSHFVRGEAPFVSPAEFTSSGQKDSKYEKIKSRSQPA